MSLRLIHFEKLWNTLRQIETNWDKLRQLETLWDTAVKGKLVDTNTLRQSDKLWYTLIEYGLCLLLLLLLLVTTRIMVLRTCVRRHGTKISTCKVHRYQCMCEMVASLYAAVETQRRIFCQVLKYGVGDPTDGLKYGEHQYIWRWVCWSQVYGHNSCKTHYIEKSKKPALP